MDMQAIDLPDSSVDAVVSRYGYMLVPDPALALRETRRVLKRGGRLAFATWAPANRNPWATAYAPVLIERGLLEPPNPDEPGQFCLGEPERIEALVRGAGFDEVAVSEVPVVFRAASWTEYRRIVSSLAASMREVLETLDDAARAEVDEAAQGSHRAVPHGRGVRASRRDAGHDRAVDRAAAVGGAGARGRAGAGPRPRQLGRRATCDPRRRHLLAQLPGASRDRPGAGPDPRRGDRGRPLRGR